MKHVVKRWWQGTYVPPENDPHSGIIFVLGSYERHWSSKAAHVLAKFWLKHWQYVISTCIAVVGILIALKKL